MSQSAYNKTRFSATGNPLQGLSPKTIAAVVLAVLMGLLWLRVLTRGKAGPASVQAADGAVDSAARATTTLQIEPVALPMIEGRNDTLERDFFSPDNWPAFGRPGNVSITPSGLSEQERQEQRRAAVFEELAKTLKLDAILHGGDGMPARVCIDGKVLTQGQSLILKRDTNSYELTLSKVSENQVVLTWRDRSLVLNMTQPERVD